MMRDLVRHRAEQETRGPRHTLPTTIGPASVSSATSRSPRPRVPLAGVGVDVNPGLTRDVGCVPEELFGPTPFVD